MFLVLYEYPNIEKKTENRCSRVGIRTNYIITIVRSPRAICTKNTVESIQNRFFRIVKLQYYLELTLHS
jgi:hypothetical protein